MAESKLEELVEERWFAGDLQEQSEVFFRLANTLLAPSVEFRLWNKRHYFQLIHESDSLETFLDDFGARFNRTYAGFTELVASLRWFANSGFSVSHLLSRFSSYGKGMWSYEGSLETAKEELNEGLKYIQETAEALLRELLVEGRKLGLEITSESFSEMSFLPLTTQKKLPRNMGQQELLKEEQKIAEVATKYMEAASMLGEAGIRLIEDEDERHRFVESKCTEAMARVYQATVHNLQSTYDTHLQNTVLEHEDERLAKLRAHATVALHLLQVVTSMAHFIERHENEDSCQESVQRIAALVKRSQVEHVTVNVFLLWAHRLLQNGVYLAQDLLPVYSNQQELDVTLAPGLNLHARPAALIVGVVQHWGTPVELEIDGHRCSAGSILELLVAVGSNSDQRDFHFEGDERPLRDIRLLFEHGLGEQGLNVLPSELNYLKDAL